MKSSLIFLAFLIAVSSGLELLSRDFHSNEKIPKEFTCDNSDFGISPELHWNSVPSHATNLALVVYDVSSNPPVTHWLVYNIPAEVHSIAQGANKKMPHHMITHQSYVPLCPPFGENHEYRFELFSFAEQISIPEGSLTSILGLLRSKALSSGILVASYGEASEKHAQHSIKRASLSEQVALAGDDGGSGSVVIITPNLGPQTLTAPAVYASTPSTQAAPPPGDVRRVMIVISITLTSGGGCFAAGIGAAPPVAPPPPNLTCGSAVGTLFLQVEQTITAAASVQYWFYASPNNKRANLIFTVKTTTTSAIEQAKAKIITLNAPVVFDVTSSADKQIFEWPTYKSIVLPNNGWAIQVTVSATVNVGLSNNQQDKFRICAAGGFTPVQGSLDLVGASTCKPIGSGAFTVTWSRVFQFGTPPAKPFLYVTGSASKREIESVQLTITGLAPVVSQVPATPSAPSCASLTVLNFSFGDVVSK